MRLGQTDPAFRCGLPSRGACALALLAPLALLGCDRGPAPAEKAPLTNIVLISIDTLRADHLGCYGYFRDTSPHMDAFARESIFFEQAYAPMATTLPSHVSMLTGLYPLEHGITANFGDGPRKYGWTPGVVSFAELAQKNGYLTAGFVSSAPLKRESGFDAGFTHYDEPPPSAGARFGQVTTDAVLAWLPANRDKPLFLFVHYFDPHSPYIPPPPYDRMYQTDAALEQFIAARQIPDRIEPDACRGTKPTVTRDATNLYDGEVRYTDNEIGRVLAALRDAGLYENSIIILTADHGEGLNQHEWPKHGRVWNEQLHVPLMIRFPRSFGQFPARVPSLVCLTDLMPTLLARLNYPWTEPLRTQASGTDVLQANYPGRPLLAQRSSRDCPESAGMPFALTTDDWRYHVGRKGERMLFNRKSDPYELTNVLESEREAARSLGKLSRQIRRAYGDKGDALARGGIASGAASAQLIEQINAMGYTGSTLNDFEEPNKPAP